MYVQKERRRKDKTIATGLEPAIPRSEVWCLIHQATRPIQWLKKISSESLKYTRKALIKSYGWFSIVPVIKHISLDSFFSLQIKCMCANSGRATMFQIKKQKFQDFFFQNCCLTLLFEKVLKNHEQKMSADQKISFTKVVGTFHILGGE